MVAVAGASVSTRAERRKASAIWATNSARKRRWFVTRTWTSAGPLAIEYATRAVMASPAHIQPYTAFKNAVTRLALSTLPLTSSVAAVPSHRSMSSSPLASSCAGGRAALLIASRLNLWHDNSSPSALSSDAADRLLADPRPAPCQSADRRAWHCACSDDVFGASGCFEKYFPQEPDKVRGRTISSR